MDPVSTLAFFEPFEPSPTVWGLCSLALALFAIGYWRLLRRGTPYKPLPAIAFLIGLGLMYVALQTHYDYYAQHLFLLHRLQHLVLHHLAPFLIAWAAPQAVFAAALPRGVPLGGYPVGRRWVRSIGASSNRRSPGSYSWG